MLFLCLGVFYQSLAVFQGEVGSRFGSFSPRDLVVVSLVLDIRSVPSVQNLDILVGEFLDQTLLGSLLLCLD